MKKMLFLSLAALMLSACTQTYVKNLSPQSHFDYPNSNIYPLGHVKGEVSKTSFSMPDMSSDLEYEAISKALEQKPGSDILLNSFGFMDITSIGPFVTVTYRVEGTAAKMVTGSKALH